MLASPLASRPAARPASWKQPAPLFGAQAKADYDAKQKADAEARAAKRAEPDPAPTDPTSQPLNQAPYAQSIPGRRGPFSNGPQGALPSPGSRRGSMNHFEYRGGELACEDLPLRQIAETVGTPVYVYSTATLERHFTVLRDALRGVGSAEPLIAYAVKANSNLSVLKTLFALGAGADTVSEGEVRRALAAGAPPERIIFSGVGKTAEELAFAVEAGVAEINVESEPELDLLSKVAAEKGVRQPIAIRINPDVAAGGHAKIATGQADAKFGVSMSEAERLYAKAVATRPAYGPVGVACHVGSQISDLAPMEAAFAQDARPWCSGCAARALALNGSTSAAVWASPISTRPDPPSPETYAAVVKRGGRAIWTWSWPSSPAG